MGPNSQAPAGWYADSDVPGQLHFWDGSAWTGRVAEEHIDSSGEAIGPRVLPGTTTQRQTKSGDLTANKPGAAARQQAVRLRKQAPIRNALARMLNVQTPAGAFRTGAEGEEIVARRLAKLDSHWCILHAVPVGDRGSDIDHVVIGPPGVFTLNTKNHVGKNVWVAERAFMVNGQKTDYLRNSRFEATRSSRMLSSACGFTVTVEPAIVVIAAQLTVKHQPSGVQVLEHRQVVKWLRHRPAVLTSEGVEVLFSHARMPSTWTSSGKGRSS
jgi:hypothetical protein